MSALKQCLCNLRQQTRGFPSVVRNPAVEHILSLPFTPSLAKKSINNHNHNDDHSKTPDRTLPLLASHQVTLTEILRKGRTFSSEAVTSVMIHR